jgi:hypothetical protein
MIDDLFSFAEVVESDISVVEEAAAVASDMLLLEVDDESEKLAEIKGAVEEVRKNFEQASEGAMRIGGRLAVLENERSRLERAMELMSLIKTFEAAPLTQYREVSLLDTMQLKQALPEAIRDKNWGEIAEVQ